MASHLLLREGRFTHRLRADPARVHDVLADRTAVGTLLLPMLDESRSSVTSGRWVLPVIRVGPRRYRVVLGADLRADDDGVELTARTTDASDLPADVAIRLHAAADPGGRAQFHADWRVRAWLHLPRPLIAVAGPTVDAKVRAVLQDVATGAGRLAG